MAVLPEVIAVDYGSTLTRPGADNRRHPVTEAAAKTVRYLCRRGHRWLLHSNVAPSSPDRRTALARAGILACFDQILLSDQIGFAKPDTRFYQAVLHAARCPADRILSVGDRLVNDGYAALAHGMHAAIVDTSGEGEQAPPHLPVLQTLADLPALLQVWTPGTTVPVEFTSEGSHAR